jgi:hypothetical protein
MQLVGRRVLLNAPKRPESVIELTPETERELEMKMIEKWVALEVFMVGTDVESVKAGDKVYVPVSSLQNAERIPVEGDTKIMIIEFDIAIIW